MVFSLSDYEKFEDEILECLRTFEKEQYKKLTEYDSLPATQMFLLLNKLGNLALQHKTVVLQQYNQLIQTHTNLIREYVRVLEAGAGNISPVANLTTLLQTLLNLINVGALLTTLGEFQGDFRTLANKPLLSYISEILQGTESLKDNNLNTAYNTNKEVWYIRPDLALR